MILFEAYHCPRTGRCSLEPEPGLEPVVWTDEDQAAASREHWDVFDTCRGPDIEMFDDDPGPWTGDDTVLTHCAAMAAFGSDLHRRALIFEQATHQHPNPEYRYEA